jgi:hypothetical protein
MPVSFPTLGPGAIMMEMSRTPAYRTLIKETPSGKEQRATHLIGVPRIKFKLAIGFLRQDAPGPTNEMGIMLSFVDSVRGNWDTFNFTDPYDGTVLLCRLDMDEIDYDRLYDKKWNIKTLQLITVK